MPHPKHTIEKEIMLFWNRLQKAGPDDCWNWLAGTTSGYGMTRYKGRHQGSHRVSWVLAHGPIPPAKCVLHRCDNRKCVNPKHLFLGTKGDNNYDRSSKGRSCKGESHHRAKLTEEKVRSIRTEYARHKVIGIDLAFKYKVSTTVIYDIVKRRIWRHVQ
mgnify:FL=1